MEWFHVMAPAIPEPDLLEVCTLSRLPELCADVYEVNERQAGERGEVSCIWGVFDTRRTAVRNGVRYELISCPNALQWTVTTRDGVTTLHGCINVVEADPDFIESITTFLANFRIGLQSATG